MIAVSVAARAIEAVDAGKNEVRVEVDGWTPQPDGPRLDRRVDAASTGAVRRLTVPEAAVSIERLDGGRWRPFDDRAGFEALCAGGHLLKFELSIVVYVRVDHPGVIEQSSADGRLRLPFDRPTPATIGFRSRIERPREAVTVPPTIEGVRTALRWQAAGLEVDSPDKAYPTMRSHPPAIAFGERTDVPDAVRASTATSDVTLAVPDSLEALFVAAPLAYYLQTDLAEQMDAESTSEATA